jgi:hypothetical protein
MHARETSYGVRGECYLSQDRAQWWALELAMLDPIRFLCHVVLCNLHIVFTTDETLFERVSRRLKRRAQAMVITDFRGHSPIPVAFVRLTTIFDIQNRSTGSRF